VAYDPPSENCKDSGEAGGAAQGKWAGEFGNYAPEKKGVQEKIKIVEDFP
jgi:hypothetical protein